MVWFEFDIYVYIPFLSSLQIVKDTCVYVYIYVVYNNVSWYGSSSIYMYILLFFPLHKSIIFSSIDFYMGRIVKDTCMYIYSIYVVYNNVSWYGSSSVYMYIYICIYILLFFPFSSIDFYMNRKICVCMYIYICST